MEKCPIIVYDALILVFVAAAKKSISSSTIKSSVKTSGDSKKREIRSDFCVTVLVFFPDRLI